MVSGFSSENILRYTIFRERLIGEFFWKQEDVHYFQSTSSLGENCSIYYGEIEARICGKKSGFCVLPYWLVVSDYFVS